VNEIGLPLLSTFNPCWPALEKVKLWGFASSNAAALTVSERGMVVAVELGPWGVRTMFPEYVPGLIPTGFTVTVIDPCVVVDVDVTENGAAGDVT
jgi:hypothetical protein